MAQPQSLDTPGVNVYQLMLEAMMSANQSMTQQQITDTQTTLGLANLEKQVNDNWYGPSGVLITTANNLPDSGDSDPKASAQFQTYAAEAQSYSSRADSLVQQSNSMVGTDSTNIQTLSQLTSMLNTVGFIANLLAK
jgi:hypothetical protein